jgi:hypothetical protein
MDKASDEKIPKQILQYKAKWCRDRGRFYERWNEYVKSLCHEVKNIVGLFIITSQQYIFFTFYY